MKSIIILDEPDKKFSKVVINGFGDKEITIERAAICFDTDIARQCGCFSKDAAPNSSARFSLSVDCLPDKDGSLFKSRDCSMTNGQLLAEVQRRGILDRMTIKDFKNFLCGR